MADLVIEYYPDVSDFDQGAVLPSIKSAGVPFKGQAQLVTAGATASAAALANPDAKLIVMTNTDAAETVFASFSEGAATGSVGLGDGLAIPPRASRQFLLRPGSFSHVNVIRSGA